MIHNSIPSKWKLLNFIKRPINSLITIIKINPDIVIIRGTGVPESLIMVFAAFFCHVLRKKYVFSIANPSEAKKEKEKGILGKLYKYVLFKADFIVAQNEAQIKDIKIWRKKEIKNIKIIKTGYKIPIINNINKETILWVGSATKVKRLNFFLKLANSFHNENFVMICTKSSNLSLWNEMLDMTHNIPNLKYYDFIPFIKIDDFFKNAKVFINTSTAEGFPNTFIQALKNKTPIISLNVDPDNFLTLNKCGFNCNNDFNKMKNNLKLLLEDHTLYNSYSINAYQYAKDNHEIKKIMNEWINLIDYIINS